MHSQMAFTNQNFDFGGYRRNLEINLTSVNYSGVYEKALIYLNSIVNFGIWKMRNDIRYKFEVFNANTLMRKVVRTIGARNRLNSKLAPSFQIPHIDQLFDAITVVINIFPFDNG